MNIKFRSRIWSFLALCFFIANSAAAAERYLVPIFASGIQGANGEWISKVVVSNPHAFPVTIRVIEIYPMVANPCPASGCTPQEIVVRSFDFAILSSVNDSTQRLETGSFVIESDSPVSVESSIYSFPREGPMYTQEIDIIRRFIRPGEKAFLSDVELHPQRRVNLFFVNPNAFAVTASYSIGTAMQEVSLPPRSTTLRQIPYPTCGSGPCPLPPPVFPPRGWRIDLAADGEFYAFASVVWPSEDALFKGAVFKTE